MICRTRRLIQDMLSNVLKRDLARSDYAVPLPLSATAPSS